MSTFYAQPYNINASGFYFETIEEYQERFSNCRDEFGAPAEVFEIQFIDGDEFDYQLCKAIGINQANIEAVLVAIEDWEDWQKLNVIIAVGECGYHFDICKTRWDHFDVELIQCESMRQFAIDAVEDGWFGDIPEALQYYIDYDSIARDLAMDYAEIEIAGTNYIYRCG